MNDLKVILTESAVRFSIGLLFALSGAILFNIFGSLNNINHSFSFVVFCGLYIGLFYCLYVTNINANKFFKEKFNRDLIYNLNNGNIKSKIIYFALTFYFLTLPVLIFITPFDFLKIITLIFVSFWVCFMLNMDYERWRRELQNGGTENSPNTVLVFSFLCGGMGISFVLHCLT